MTDRAHARVAGPNVSRWIQRRAALLAAAALVAPCGTAAAAPAAVGTETLFGTVVAKRTDETFAQAQQRADTTYGGLDISRVFYIGAPKAWPGDAGLSGRPVVVSFKYLPPDVNAGMWDAALAKWFRTAPTDRDVYWSYIHEPEDDIERGEYTAGQYRAAFRRVAEIATRDGGANLHATLIMMCWTIGLSGRDWTDYYAGADVVDVFAFDCYNWAGRQGYYVDPAQLFARVVEFTAARGKPWGIAEVGSIKVASDTTGAERAEWLRAVARHLDSNGPLFVNYFDVKLKTDYRLLDVPSQEAWREVVTTY